MKGEHILLAGALVFGLSKVAFSPTLNFSVPVNFTPTFSAPNYGGFGSGSSGGWTFNDLLGIFGQNSGGGGFR